MKLRLKHNFTSTWSQEEYDAYMGFRVQDEEEKPSYWSWGPRGDEQGLTKRDVKVDHVADGHMTPVKSQGSCGSCWAFSATSTLEGTYAAKSGKKPERVSEQQIMDCSKRNCDGGHMQIAWKMYRDDGVMLDKDYPYRSGETGKAHSCKHDEDKVKYFVVDPDDNKIVENVEEAMEKVK